MSNAQEIITIDGPSGSGKSTISRSLANLFGYAYLDTGAMYRAVGLQASRSGIDLQNVPHVTELLESIDIQILPGKGDCKVLLNGEDVSLIIRSPEMSMMASTVSALPAVRKKLTMLQQLMGDSGRIVAEGRDMGTVVFPQAAYKFYLNATAEERARRRTEQLKENGIPADFDDILAQTKKRDHNDSSRTIAPLKAASDAIYIDSSTMTIDEVIHFIAEKIKTIQHNNEKDK